MIVGLGSPADRAGPKVTNLSGLRVLVVGTGSPNADMVAEVLNSHGVKASWTDKVKGPNPLVLRQFQVVYGIYLPSCARYILMAKLLGKKTVVHFVGSDAYWFARERTITRRLFWRVVLKFTDLIFYVSPHLEGLVGRPGIVLPFPIATDKFRNSELRMIAADRNVLYYCPSGPDNERVYRLTWILDYAKRHPSEKITILGSMNHPARYMVNLPNVLVIPFVQRSAMPHMYRRHGRLIRMTTEDGLPRMVHEALLCGLRVTFNGQEIMEIPMEREPPEFASAFRRALNSLFDRTP